MNHKKLLSDDNATVAAALAKAVDEDKNSTSKEKARTGQKYYDYEHDILNNRIFYLDDNDVLREDHNASNVKIPHAFHTELVDQKVQYLLSNPVTIEVEDEAFKERLEEYYDDDFQLFLQEAVEGASNKGKEYVFARTIANDRLCFQVSDSLHTFPVYDETNNLKGIVRYYNKDVEKDGKVVSVEFAEVWDEKQVTFYVKEDKNGSFKFDSTRDMNPRPHVIATDRLGNILKRSYGSVPFYRLSNNKQEKSDLEPIKALIDDYDLMAAFLSNNLQDFAEAIYVVKGFRGDDLSKLRQNVKAKKVVSTSSDGGVEVKTVNIPVDARKTKLDIDKDAIYKFGMGFDSTQIGDGNITNVVIKSRYALLDMKANKAEVRLRSMLSWCNEMIVADINRRFKTAYKANDITVNIVRETMVNEKDIVEVEKIKEETRAVVIESILAVASRLDDESVLKLICEQFELDWEEVQLLIEEQEYSSGLQDDTDPVEGEDDAGAGQVA
ncbi:phage portal protein, SPP1 family [Alkalibacterium putridalgicola]|uniref:Phage portal protein, SPP1 family n=1 Tax=Alkalibacterium putridalgicola TaxID=426703 RepID=A0A1H7RNJ0_9LACT|nr:phage portal protein [Alkalibacterium putridalgicola]SEL60957.1 phage portal protein, SPP1 family [Alkalibacterium putridalgicola]